MKPKAKSKLYGQVAVEFANAENVESACLGILDRLKKVFNFLKDFPEKVIKVFPRLSGLTSFLTQTEKEIIRSIYQDEDFYKICFYLIPSGNFRPISYDPDEEFFECIDLTNQRIGKIKAKDLEKKYPFEPEIVRPAGRLLNNLKLIFSKEMCSKISRPFWEIPVILEHYHFAFMNRKLLVGSLDHIAAERNLYECESFRKILDQQSETWISGLELNKDGSLCWREVFNFEKNLKSYTEINSVEFISLAALSCLVEFLLQSPTNRKFLKKCLYCKKFFISEDIRRKTRCYSENCEKAHQRYKKIKQRENDPVKYI